ncbi:MAG: RNA polymerase sigma factor RpoD/SigA [Bacteroidales bacterium]|nr:RNA polymerase sigma factor RpoD/SigA [Bacteroidales bacterium]
MRQLKISKSITSRNQGTLDKYLSDIAKEPLITAEEEVALAQRIREGDQVALERLVNANLRFVVSVAKQYQNQGISLQDLINEGNIGLVKAAQRFDETRGFKFISYAVWWIRQSILQAVAEQSRIVRLPLNQVGAINRVKKAINVLEHRLQRKPTVEEIAEETGLTPEKVLTILSNNTQTISTDAPIDEDGETNFLDLFIDQNETPTDAAVEQELNEKTVRKSLDVLSDKEQQVLRMYFGIGMPREYTLEEIAFKMDISRERTRQIRDRALKRLRTEPNSPLFKMFMNQ